MSAPRRSFILHRLENCPEAPEAIKQWRDGEWTFEEALISILNRVLLDRAELQRNHDYIPPQVRAQYIEDGF